MPFLDESNSTADSGTQALNDRRSVCPRDEFLRATSHQVLDRRPSRLANSSSRSTIGHERTTATFGPIAGRSTGEACACLAHDLVCVEVDVAANHVEGRVAQDPLEAEQVATVEQVELGEGVRVGKF